MSKEPGETKKQRRERILLIFQKLFDEFVDIHCVVGEKLFCTYDTLRSAFCLYMRPPLHDDYKRNILNGDLTMNDLVSGSKHRLKVVGYVNASLVAGLTVKSLPLEFLEKSSNNMADATKTDDADKNQ